MAQTSPAESETWQTSIDFLRLYVNTKVEKLRFLEALAPEQKLPEDTVFVAYRQDKLSDVFKGLIQRNLLSVPVLRQKGDEDTRFYGLLDMGDLVRFIVHHFGFKKLSMQDFWQLAEQEENFQTKTVDDLLAQAPVQKRHLLHNVKVGYSVFFATEILACERTVHRLPIIDHDKRLIGMITQSQLVRFLHKNIDILGPKTTKPLEKMEGVMRDVCCISMNAQAFEAFKAMDTNAVPVLAVVDDQRKLVDAISLRDLRGIGGDARRFWTLFDSVLSYLEHIRKTQEHTPIYCKPSDTLHDVVGKIVEHHIHHVFVVDDNNVPVGVVGITDILREVVTNV